jgi:protease-4
METTPPVMPIFPTPPTPPPAPAAPLPPPAPAPKRTGWMVYAIIATFFLCFSLLANMALFGMLFATDGPGTGASKPHFEEQLLQGDTDSKNKILVIYLTGVITSANDDSLSREGMVGDLKAQLVSALDDDHVKAIVLRINSPGGEVVASDAIYRALRDARDEKPIVASMETVGASGAYYAAVGCTEIMASDLTITGSIGVIMQSFTFGGLMDKVGVKSHTFKSGRYKDLLNPTREPTDEEKQMVQTLIMEVYDKFVGIVAEERHIKVADLKNGMADGRILSGNQALQAGFVDGLGDFDAAVDKAMALAKISSARVVTYQPVFTLRQLLRIFGKQDQAKIQVQLANTPALKLDTGKLYFLPAYMFQ